MRQKTNIFQKAMSKCHSRLVVFLIKFAGPAEAVHILGLIQAKLVGPGV